MSRAIYWHPVEFHDDCGMTFKAMADYSRDRHGHAVLNDIKLTHINGQPIVHGWDMRIDPADMACDRYDYIAAQIRSLEPPDEDCITETRRMALAEWVNS